MKICLHQTHLTIADFSAVFDYLQKQLLGPDKTINIYPEMFLTGYPLQDLALQKPFISQYQKLLEQINAFSLTLTPKHQAHLLGGLEYQLNNQDYPVSIENVIYLLLPGKSLEKVYTKQLLPNYDIFDEKKYFRPGNKSVILPLFNYQFALMICEDMWPSNHYPHNPVLELSLLNAQLDGIINLSASPFYLGKLEKRLERGKEISQILNAPFFYVNKVGAEDEIIFDGASFITCGDQVKKVARSFQADQLTIDLDDGHLTMPTQSLISIDANKSTNTWEELFSPQLQYSSQLPTLRPWSSHDCQEALAAIKLGVQDYARKCHLKKFVVALSGGIDSALVTVLAKLSLASDQNLEAIYMMGRYSAGISYQLAKELCDNLQIKLNVLPIKFLHATCKNQINEHLNFDLTGLSDENIQSRLRGTLLFAYANQHNAMVLNTSNKSELAVGYSTLYGDSVGALSLLGDLFKTEVYYLANYLNHQYGNLIPQQIIARPPSAELREDQEDAQSLPPYERLDAILEGIISNQMSAQDLINCGLDTAEVNQAFRLYQLAEFKRFQFCPIIKIKPKSFGFGHRLPICRIFHQ